MKRFPRYLLVKKYKLGNFHISTEHDKKYVAAIKEYLNRRTNRNSVIEIGVGLGDILLGLDFKNLVAADHKQQILDALKTRLFFRKNNKNVFLKKIKFQTDSIEGIYDVVILVNWVHTINSEIFKKKLESIYNNNLSDGGEIIFDVVTDKNNSGKYAYSHSPKFLNENICSIIISLGKYNIGPKSSDLSRQIFSFVKKL